MKAKGLKNESRSRTKTTAPVDASPKIDKRTREKIINRDAERIASLAAVMFREDDYDLDVCVERAERVLALSYRAARRMHSPPVVDRALTFSEFAMRVCSDTNVTRAREKLISAWIGTEIRPRLEQLFFSPEHYKNLSEKQILDEVWLKAEAAVLKKTELTYRESNVAQERAVYKKTEVYGRDDPHWVREIKNLKMMFL